MTQRQLHIWVAILVFGHLLLTIASSILTPLAEAPDEADHWAYVVYLAQEQSLPVGPKVTQGKHPPLYHIIASLITTSLDPDRNFLRPNSDVSFVPSADWAPNFFIHTSQEDWPWQGSVLAFHLVRFWSVLLSTATVVAAYFLMREAFPHQPSVTLSVVGMLAFLPEFIFIGGAVNNDNAAAFFGTLGLWGGLRIYRGVSKAMGWTALILGLGFLSKVSTLGIWPAVGIAIVLGAAKDLFNTHLGTEGHFGARLRLLLKAIVQTWRRWLLNSVMVFGGALLVASPWLLRNWYLYGDPLGLSMARQTVDLRLAPWTVADTIWLLRGWFISFWGAFGAIGHVALPQWIYGLFAFLSAICFIGLLKLIGMSLLSRSPLRPSTTPLVSLSILSFLIVASLGVVAVMWRYSLLALGTDQARLLYPAISSLVTLWVVGLFAGIPNRLKGILTSTLLISMFILSLYGLFGVLHPAFAPPTSLSFEQVATQNPTELRTNGNEPVDAILFGEIVLIGWNLNDEPTLYWYAPHNPSVDWRTRLRITSPDGTLVWEWNRSPGSGRWSTDRWEAGAIVSDIYNVRWPDWAGPGQYRVEVGVYPFGQEVVVPEWDSLPLTTDEHRLIALGWLNRP